MLFHKVHLSPKAAKADAEIKVTPRPLYSLADKPVYILGNTAWAYFLAAKFELGGIRTIILAGEKENTSLNTNGITIKEDYQLQKLHCRLETSLWQKEEALAVIIACDSSQLKAGLLSLSKNKLKNTPIISFSLTKDKNFISDILGHPVTQAYYEGWLKLANQQILVYGQSPEITLCTNNTSETYQLFASLTPKANLTLKNNSIDDLAFWNFFCLYAPCSLLTAKSGKNIFEITKNKALREQLLTSLNEIVLLPPKTLPPYNPDELLKKIFNIPSAYDFPLAEQITSGKTGSLDFISSVIQQAAFEKKCLLPATNELLKNLYEQILKKQSS